MLQSTDVHMVSDSEGDDFEDAPEFGVEESEIFGMGSSSCRKSLMSKFYSVISSGVDREGMSVLISVLINSLIFSQCQKTVKMRVMPYCTLLLNFLEGEISGQSNICNPISRKKTKLQFFIAQYAMSCTHFVSTAVNIWKYLLWYLAFAYVCVIFAYCVHVCFVDMAIAILCSTSAPWKQHLKRPFMAKPEMWV